jgi:hypothetical protein
MANITVKNIPEPVYSALKEAADREHRSLNGQIIYLIEKGIKYDKCSTESVLETARTYRAKTSGFTLTEEILKSAREYGRQ